MIGKNFVEEAKIAIIKSSESSTIYVGCDSNRFKKAGNWYASYAKVILIHKDSKHGCIVFGDIEVIPDYGNLKQRLMQEVAFTALLAIDVIEVIGDREMEVHIDVNSDPKHKSNVVAKEAAGYIRGVVGIEPKLKPESFVASHCADHFCRI